MKSFHTLLFLIVIVLVGGLGFMYWASSVDQAVQPIAEVAEVDQVEEVAEVDPGTYLVFESSLVSDPGTEARANDNTETYTYYRLWVDEIGTAQPQSFTEIVHPASVAGGLTAEVYGQGLLLHRYQDESQDAVLSLTGEILSTSDQNWDRFRSKNGRYEVTHTFGPDIADTDSATMRVEDLETGEVIERTYSFAEVALGWPGPHEISDDGKYVYFVQTCGCDGGPLTAAWEVNTATGEIIELHELFDSDGWRQNSFDLETKRFLVIASDSEQRENDMGPYSHPIAPALIRLIDTTSSVSTDLVLDDEQAWMSPWLDPEGDERYIVSSAAESYRQYLVKFTDDEITEQNYLTTGYIMDWVGDWIVTRDLETQKVITLVNVETSEQVVIELPADRFNYVGSVVID